ncbi:class II fructose-bisphosphatase [Pseudoclavibacter caeni]|jgi:fructose-1,6-bisphosphatase II|uniref:Fructose-1,6-bisphosphatase n=1 Tax=Pseudoclavibacter caeni TaxID=908846 RepID=A0A7C8FSI6_9MICO|nr:class II fructose-bisphosphatase [Pseudoclavibacter caeni]KAB1631893.1 class II fructose-bisphosphatase [Pseudoclavibacter caeni]NYJ96914.1 fructose-1,6-bisphosphatase II [Pseudoclavibacter caeni]
MTDQSQQPDRNLALELVRSTEAAAIRASAWAGRGQKNEADGAAVNAMRQFLHTVSFDGVVVIGEGEKDKAPMLFNGEHVGDGTGVQVDIAVDPIDGTTQTAAGRPNAVSIMSVADRGSMLDASSVFYMDKIVTDRTGVGVVSLDQSPEDNIRELARAKGKPVGEMTVIVLDRPRHEELIERIRSVGAKTSLILDGDVVGGINAASPWGDADLLIGRGGSPEGVITAAAIKAFDGFMQGRLAPKDDAERQRGIDAGLDVDRIYGGDDLVASDNTFFVGTGVTDGVLLKGVKGPRDGYIHTQSIVLRSKSGTVRWIEADHLASKWA